MKRCSLSLLVALLLATCGPPSASAADSVATEAQLKTAFVFSFLKFVTFPEAKLRVNVCVRTRDELLQKEILTLHGRTAAGAHISVIDLGAAAAGPCDVLFLTGLADEAIRQDLERYPRALTIGDGEEFLDKGGIIALARSNERVTFSIALRRAQERGISFSSTLLRLASAVRK